jgi:hypothetical protein
MKELNLDLISDQIAKKILFEEFATEKERQDAVSKQISSDDLEAPDHGNQEKERITDEGEEDEGSGDDETIEPKSKPGSDEDDSADDFEVKAVKDVPNEVAFEDIKKQINNLRAGHSLKDEAVSSQLEDYFDMLGQAEERSLYVFLSSLGAILTGGTLGDEAPRPESMGVDISMRKKKEKSKKVPAVDKEGAQAPIIVGEVSSTSKYKMQILEAMTSDEKHRCINGKLTNFGSSKCINDISVRIDDATFTRDKCSQGSANRASLNGTLKYLRQKLRLAQKIAATK